MSPKKKAEVLLAASPMSNLVSLAIEASQIARLLLESEGELTPDLETRLDVNGASLAQKADSYRFVIDELELQADMWKRRQDACASQKKKFEAQADRMRDRIKEAMKVMNATEVAGNFYKFQLRKSKPKLIIDNEAALPHDCKMVVQRTVVDTDKVKSALEGGFEVPGARLEETGSLYILDNSKKD